PVLPRAWQENLLHIGQEALSNTLKYARAKHFRTRLASNAREFRLELSDDGNGFRVRERHDGVGLAGMRERVQEMGGELKIVSSRGKGTKITVILPKDAVRQLGAIEARSDKSELGCGASVMNTKPEDTFQSKGGGSAKPFGHGHSSVQSPKPRIRVLIADD